MTAIPPARIDCWLCQPDKDCAVITHNSSPTPAASPTSDLRRGLIWLALGIGSAILFLKVFEDSGLWALGLIPAFIGVAYLLCWGIGVARERRERGRTGGDLWPGIFWTLFGISLALAMRSLNMGSFGNWGETSDWWGVSLIPIGVGIAFLLHALVSWWIERKRAPQG